MKAIFIHDLDKDSPYREWIEKIFLNCFFIDDRDYIAKFKNLDKKCWLELRKHRNFKSWAPYRWKNSKLKSYFSTLSVIINSDEFYDPLVYNNLLKSVSKKNNLWKFKIDFKNWPNKIKNINISFIIYIL